MFFFIDLQLLSYLSRDQIITGLTRLELQTLLKNEKRKTLSCFDVFCCGFPELIFEKKKQSFIVFQSSKEFVFGDFPFVLNIPIFFHVSAFWFENTNIWKKCIIFFLRRRYYLYLFSYIEFLFNKLLYAKVSKTFYCISRYCFFWIWKCNVYNNKKSTATMLFTFDKWLVSTMADIIRNKKLCW